MLIRFFIKDTKAHVGYSTCRHSKANIDRVYSEKSWWTFGVSKEKKEKFARSPLIFVASATNLGLGIRKLPNAPASEFTSTTTATLTRTHATMWQHVPSAHICTARDMRRLGTYSTYLRRCGYIFYKTFLIPRRITGETRKGWCAEVTRTRRTPAGRRRGGERENRGGGGGKKRRGGGRRDKERQDEGRRERRAWTFRETRKNATPPRHDRNIFVFTKLCIPRASAISLKA